MSQVGGPLALVYLAINAGVTVNVDVCGAGSLPGVSSQPA